MGLCQNQQCRRYALYNVEGSKSAAYCRQHAEDGMVNVRHKRCSYDACTKFPSMNFEGGKTSVYCKQHAENGMVYLQKVRRCSHDSCTKTRSFNFEGRKTPEYCKQHAHDSMVYIAKRRRCSHDSCVRRPSFNFEANKTAMFCKQHAEDGMVNINYKRCSHDSCTKKPIFNFEGGHTAMFCKQHAGDGKVYFNKKKVCSHGSCATPPFINVEGSATPVNCKQHAEDGMVNVRTNCDLADDVHTGREPRSVPVSVVSKTCNRQKSDVFDCSANISDSWSEVSKCLKRSRPELEGKQPPNTLDANPVKVYLVQPVERGHSQASLHTSSSSDIRRHLGDRHTVGVYAKKTRQVAPLTAPLLPDKHQSGKPIKTEMGLTVLI